MQHGLIDSRLLVVAAVDPAKVPSDQLEAWIIYAHAADCLTNQGLAAALAPLNASFVRLQTEVRALGAAIDNLAARPTPPYF